MKRTYPAFALALSLMFSGLSLAQNPPALKVTGIVNLGQYQRAILERTDVREAWHQFLLLAEGQREEEIEVLSVRPEQGEVEVRFGGTNLANLRMENEGNRTSSGITLENAALEPVLRVYSQLANRTLLRAPVFGQASFNLRAPGADADAGARALERALAEKEIATIADGTKFILVVPAAMAGRVKPRSTELKPAPQPAPGSLTGGNDILPPGVINFPGTDMHQVLEIYCELVGRKLARNESSKTPFTTVQLFTQNPLSKQEAVYAFDRVLELRGIKMVPVGPDKIKPVPIAEQ